ncbi:MAG TPA: hypothetical protein VM324_13695 [Egibacteraceae bacterium]|nr:hypothetical protein [Egibacteraceae bacterium]
MRVKALLLVLALALAGTGCDRGEDRPGRPEGTTAPGETSPDGPATDEALERVAEAAQNTLDEGTARFTLVVHADDMGAATGQPTTIEGEGEDDFGADRRRLSAGAEGEQEIIVDGAEAYLLLPARGVEQWGRLDLGERSAGAAGALGGAGPLALRNSRGILALLTDQATEARDAGEDDVDGQEATRYEVTVPLAGSGRGEGGDAAGGEELAMDVWVDADDRVRQVAYTTQVTPAAPPDDAGGDAPDDAADDAGGDAADDAQAEGYAVAVTLTYVEFGVEVEIELPEEEMIFDLGG